MALLIPMDAGSALSSMDEERSIGKRDERASGAGDLGKTIGQRGRGIVL